MTGTNLCLDCGMNALEEYYMVRDSVWKLSGLPPRGGDLCIGCLENRIGRRLTAADFTDALVNHGYFPRSARHLNRLGEGVSNQ